MSGARPGHLGGAARAVLSRLWSRTCALGTQGGGTDSQGGDLSPPRLQAAIRRASAILRSQKL